MSQPINVTITEMMMRAHTIEGTRWLEIHIPAFFETGKYDAIRIFLWESGDMTIHKPREL